MPVHDDLGKRMKEFYEQIPKTRLMRRMPVCIRLDGMHFHSFTKGFQKPFDEVLIKSMQLTAKYLCENIQGVVASYQQSDEITLILIDYQKFTSEAWFDYEVQKMCSASASMATIAFNKYFKRAVTNEDFEWKTSLTPQSCEIQERHKIYMDVLNKAVEKGATFDSRCFNIPKEEVTNMVYWRQLDATRNSIQMVGQANFTHKELHGKSCNMIQDMLMMQKNINWNDLPTYQKRGTCCIRNKMVSEPWGNKMMTNEVEEGQWFIDKNIPIFKGEDRKYIDDLIYVGEGL